MNVLLVGFDAPHIDCIALLRPTLSLGLYYQIVGRSSRLHPSKADCLVLDFVRRKFGDDVFCVERVAAPAPRADQPATRPSKAVCA